MKIRWTMISLLLAWPLFAQQSAGKRPLSDQDVKVGKAVYMRECAACHGEKGDGQGPAAAFLEIKPRDFTKKYFKIRTTDSGQPPTTADLLKTVEHGIPGTAMPSFSFLTPDERRQTIAYVLTLADIFDDPEPAPIAAPGKAPKKSNETIAKGKEIYEKLGCVACHGSAGKGDGPSSANLTDNEGNPIKVRDFTGGQFRGGSDPVDLYYRFVTGMDGSPMPAFAETVQGNDRWALIDYVMSLKVPQPKVEYPKDPIEAGRMVTAKYNCRGCHVLDDGQGGVTGPDLRVSGKKLGIDWVKTFLKDPRAYGKIYPWREARMPRFNFDKQEIEVLAAYVVAMGKRTDPIAKKPDPSKFTAEELESGKTFFVLRCTECHNLGKTIEIPEAKRQGPDLARVAGRVDYDFAIDWIMNPQKIDPKTKMTVPGVTPEQAAAVRNFVWKTSMETK
jgi:mono/diheme cytochrome c family protein